MSRIMLLLLLVMLGFPSALHSQAQPDAPLESGPLLDQYRAVDRSGWQRLIDDLKSIRTNPRPDGLPKSGAPARTEGEKKQMDENALFAEAYAKDPDRTLTLLRGVNRYLRHRTQQDRSQKKETRRFALVVGSNGSNWSRPELANINGDATLVANTLKSLGFTIFPSGMPLVNEAATGDAIVQNLRDLTDLIYDRRDKEIFEVVFYFTGHGGQWEDYNVLVPSDGRIAPEPEFSRHIIKFETEILAPLRNSYARMSVVIIDACRSPMEPYNIYGLNHPQSGLKNPAEESPGTSTHAPVAILYSAEPGTLAYDNSHFAEKFSSQIQVPGQELRIIGRNMSESIPISRGSSLNPLFQKPSLDDRSDEDFYFNRANVPSLSLSPNDICDIFAADPDDIWGDRYRSDFADGITPERGASACKEALSKAGEIDVPRFSYQLARALQRFHGRITPESADLFQSALRGGYPPALAREGERLLTASDGNHYAEAMALFLKAQDGSLDAKFRVADCLWQTEESCAGLVLENEAEARRVFLALKDLNYPGIVKHPALANMLLPAPQ